MALTLSTSNPDQSTMNRPNDPRDPNGIAHATNTVTPADTKADRATSKLAYATWLATWKSIVWPQTGLHQPAEFASPKAIH